MNAPAPVADRFESRTPLVRVSGVTKSFGGVRALRGVDLEVFPGEVRALLGENGAGKSTLIKILSGVHTSDDGRIEIAGRDVAFASPAQSRAAGVAVVYQDLSLVESLSVGANLMLGREPRTKLGFVRKRQLMAEVRAFLRDHNIPLDPRASVASLPFAYRQMTEICKALMGDLHILILDEPTSALTEGEERILFDAVRAVTQRGVAVIYVTHRLNEVFRIADSVTVFRDGANAGNFVTAQTDMKQLVAAIVGPDHAAHDPRSLSEATHAKLADAESVLTMSGVTNDRLRGVDLTVHAGEIHGLAGLIGSGRTEILETIFGLRSCERGTIRVRDVDLTNSSTPEAIDAGVALVPEDRHVQGLVLDHAIERNLTLPRLPHFSRFGWLQRKASQAAADVAMRQLSIRAPGTATLVRNLSGGNQQKVVFAKWSEPRPQVLLLDEPTIGVDVGAREEIYALVRAAARSGTAVLVVSSDLAELLSLCDRISIVVDGAIAQTVERDALDNAEALHHLIQLPRVASTPTS
jgi:ribose transport system ATP-binding protein